jgi:hypothetical protein
MQLNVNLGRPGRYRVPLFGFILLLGWTGGSAFATRQSPVNDPESAPAVPMESEENSAALARSHVALPDAPEPAFTENEAPGDESSFLQSAFSLSPAMPESRELDVTPNVSERVPLNQCPTDTTHARECRVHWGPLLITSAAFTAVLSAGNSYMGYWYRWETTHGKWFGRWFDSDLGWSWQYWNDGNPALDEYVGHPMMGSITDYIWIQNDPKGATVQIGEPGYWKSRVRALAFTTAFHFMWKFGPFGEAGVGHIGDHPTHSVNGQPRNDTGDVELVTTPVGGLLWTMAEDLLDKHVLTRFEEKPRRPTSLLLISFLTPSRATANIFRWRPPWYRDGRVVKANSFWSDPPGPEEGAVSGDDPGEASGAPRDAVVASSGVQGVRKAQVLPVWLRPGGVHEFGAWWGYSPISGHIWGYADDIVYMPIDVSYSYLINPGATWNFRYAPELTALAMLDEPVKGSTNPLTQRKRTYGSGVSPVGFRASFFPESRVQPFLSTDGGFIYFTDRVLSAQGSQFMYTIDFGGGVQIFHKQRQAISLGYRYQHLSNANISHHNPGTDTNLFYLAVSRFRTKQYR